MPQQAQRKLALVGGLGPFPKQHHHVLEVLVPDGGHELQLEGVPVAVGEKEQAPLLPGFFPLIRHPEAQQRLLPGQAQALDGHRAPAETAGALAQERLHPGHGGVVQLHFDAPPARAGQLHEQGQHNGDEAAGGHAVSQQHPPGFAEGVGENRLVLETRPDPEPQPGHRRLAVIDPVLDDDPHPLNEQQGEQHGEVGGGHGIGNGQGKRRQLGHERQDRQDDADVYPDVPGGHPGHLGQGNARRVGRVGHRARDPGQQVAHPVGGDRTLHGAEIDRPLVPPGDALNGHRVADGLNGPDQGHEHERRQQRPERGPQVPLEPLPASGGEPDPGGGCYTLDLVQAEQRSHPAADDDADDGGPQPPGTCRPQAQGGHRDKGDPGGHRGRGRRRPLGNVGQHVEGDRHDGHGDQHDHRAGDDRGEDSPQQRQPRRQGELEKRRNDDEGCEQRRAALHQCRYAHRDEGAGGAHDEDVPGADAAEANRLQDRGGSADHEGGEDGPGHVGLVLVRRPDHDGRGQDDPGQDQHGRLNSHACGQQVRRTLVGLIADPRVAGPVS